MQGENRLYLKKRSEYLQNRLIKFEVVRKDIDNGDEHDHIDNVFVHSGFDYFDLAPRSSDTVNVRTQSGFRHIGVELRRFEARTKQGKTTSKPAGIRTKRLKAYYLPFRANQGHTMQLGDDADLFFTPVLNGCTFACGSGSAQSPRVSHINLQNPPGQIDQNAINTMVQAIHGVNVRFAVRRSYYKPDEIGAQEDFQANIVGFRRVTGWEFWIQMFKIDFSNNPFVYTIRSNTKISNGVHE